MSSRFCFNRDIMIHTSSLPYDPYEHRFTESSTDACSQTRWKSSRKTQPSPHNTVPRQFVSWKVRWLTCKRGKNSWYSPDSQRNGFLCIVRYFLLLFVLFCSFLFFFVLFVIFCSFLPLFSWRRTANYTSILCYVCCLTCCFMCVV